LSYTSRMRRSLDATRFAATPTADLITLVARRWTRSRIIRAF
jgi:hypothetical protein